MMQHIQDSFVAPCSSPNTEIGTVRPLIIDQKTGVVTYDCTAHPLSEGATLEALPGDTSTLHERALRYCGSCALNPLRTTEKGRFDNVGINNS